MSGHPWILLEGFNVHLLSQLLQIGYRASEIISEECREPVLASESIVTKR